MGRVLRILKWSALVLVVAIAGIVAWCYYVLQMSRPRLTGELAAPGLTAPVVIARDANGAAAVTAADRRDAAYATGFLHAQERYFQMDLARRIGAGELAELFGDNILPIDRDFRRHRLRAVAERAVDALPGVQRDLLSAYVDGVNAGLRDLGRPPLEYAVLMVEPEPWTAADSLLVILNMFILLQDRNGEQEFSRHALYARLPREVADFLAVAGDPDWDAPLSGDAVAATPPPTSEVFSLRGRPPAEAIAQHERAPISGSNAWAMSGRLTTNGAAIVANDMHLGYGVPNTFYRLQLQIGPADAARRLVGVTLPGVPALVAGSNGDIAWGFTNSAGDYSDIVLLDDYDAKAGTYRGASGQASVVRIVERIGIKGADPESFEIATTPWGPVHTVDDGRSHYAIRWVAHEPEAVNLGLFDLEAARTTAQALALAGTIGIPAQNLVVGDRAGAVGWTIAGRLPQRDVDGVSASHSADAGTLWSGWLPPAAYPRLTDPDSGRLWTANARVVDGEGLRAIGLGYYALGARAKQIRDRLFELPGADERAMLALQMDHRALFLQRWHGVLRDVVAGAATLPQRDELARLLAGWDGSAAGASPAYPYVRGFREQVRNLAFAPYVALVRERFPAFELHQLSDQYEAPLWQLVSARPAHLLPPEFESWDALLQAALVATIKDLDRKGGPGKTTWGALSRLEMRHPMSAFIPGFPTLFDMPSEPLDGDVHMPLAQTANHGPVQRMVVRPGAEETGFLSMPAGQTGHPLMPYYRAGHNDWLSGAPVPLLAGAEAHRLRLVPP